MKEMVFKLMDSWNDPIYSHLRTFRKFDPMFSKRDKLYDHSTRTMIFGNDELFVTKDVVIHTAKRNYTSPNDYIRLRFNCDTIRESNGESDFLLKFDIMCRKIGGIWKDIEKKDFVSQRFKLSDMDFTMQNRKDRFEIAKENWKAKHNKVCGNYKRHDHPLYSYQPHKWMKMINYMIDRIVFFISTLKKQIVVLHIN